MNNKHDIMTTLLHSAWNTAYSETSTVNDCMMMDNIQSDVKNQIIEMYMKQNNPSPYTDSYYPQYHVVDFVVFNVQAAKAFECIQSHLTHNKSLENKYTRHYSYKLTRRRECINSYSSIIQLIFTYPRRQNKAAKGDESVYSFLQTSKNSDRCRDDWASYITACRPYDYLSKAEFIKLLNTHSDGCYVSSEEYNRFHALESEWHKVSADLTCATSTNTGGGEAGAEGDTDSDGSSSHIARSSSSRRSFSTPHSRIGLKSTAGGNVQKSSDDAGDAAVVTISSNDSTSATAAAIVPESKQILHLYYLSTGFMQHSICDYINGQL